MGSRGPVAKAFALRIAGARKSDEKFVEFIPARPPSHLRGVARATWKRLAPVIGKAGLLTPADYEALTLYCEQFALYRSLREAVEANGASFVKRTRKGVVTGVRLNPEVTAANKVAATLRSLGAELGLSPASRARVKVSMPEEEKEKKPLTQEQEAEVRIFGELSK